MKMSRVLRIMSVLAVLAAVVLGSHFAAARDERAELLKVRESVWRAWFVNDAKALEQLVPPGTIVISSGEEKWKDRAEILRSAAAIPSIGRKIGAAGIPAHGDSALWRRRGDVQSVCVRNRSRRQALADLWAGYRNFRAAQWQLD